MTDDADGQKRPEGDLTVKAAIRGIVDFVKMVTGAIAAGGALITGIWYVWGEHLEAIADLPETQAAITEKLVNIQRDIDKIRQSQNARLRPVVEVFGTPRVYPGIISEPQRVFAEYFIRRNEACTGTIVIRWWDVESGSYDPRFQKDIAVRRAPVTPSPHLWRLLLDVPDLGKDGLWAYHPEHVPGPDCSSDLPVMIPPAYIEWKSNE